MILKKGIEYDDVIFSIGTRDNKKFIVDIIEEQFEKYSDSFIEASYYENGTNKLKNKDFCIGNYGDFVLKENVYLIEVKIILNGKPTTIQILENAIDVKTAYKLSQNEELPSGYEENSWDTQKIYNSYGNELEIPFCE